MFEVPFSAILQKQISFKAEAKQIIYLGDYLGLYVTYICLHSLEQLYTFRGFKVDVTDEFETAKNDFSAELMIKSRRNSMIGSLSLRYKPLESPAAGCWRLFFI